MATIIRDTNSADLSIHHTFDQVGRLRVQTYFNGARIERDYDDADRLTVIRHYDAGNVLRMRSTYVWNRDNTIDYRTDEDWTGATPTVDLTDFQYDQRKQLRRETRTRGGTEVVYDLEYTYDQLGNRQKKIDHVRQVTTRYEYDVDHYNPVEPEDSVPLAFETRNNRLLASREFDAGGPGGAARLRRTVKYVYYTSGDASNITVKDEYLDATATPGSPADYEWHYDLALYYWSDGRLWRALRSRWKEPTPGTFTQYERLALREFFFDSGRERTMWRDVDPQLSDTLDPAAVTLSDLRSPEHWTDYVGVDPAGDFQRVGPGSAETTAGPRYLPAAGTQAENRFTGTGAAPADSVRYYHGDMVRTTNLLTTGEGATATIGGQPARMTFTAFGEPVRYVGAAGSGQWVVGAEYPTTVSQPPGENPRYQYAGGWGYESGLVRVAGANPTLPAVTLQHVGERWLDPASGRFVQADRIGLGGGVNLYLYCANNPTLCIDPSGNCLYGADWDRGPINIIGGWIAGVYPGIANWSDTGIVAGAVGGSVVIGVGGYIGAGAIGSATVAAPGLTTASLPAAGVTCVGTSAPAVATAAVYVTQVLTRASPGQMAAYPR